MVVVCLRMHRGWFLSYIAVYGSVACPGIQTDGRAHTHTHTHTHARAHTHGDSAAVSADMGGRARSIYYKITRRSPVRCRDAVAKRPAVCFGRCTRSLRSHRRRRKDSGLQSVGRLSLDQSTIQMTTHDHYICECRASGETISVGDADPRINDDEEEANNPIVPAASLHAACFVARARVCRKKEGEEMSEDGKRQRNGFICNAALLRYIIFSLQLSLASLQRLSAVKSSVDSVDPVKRRYS
jgi:predicted nucleic acid-binding Zn ribbon protein